MHNVRGKIHPSMSRQRRRLLFRLVSCWLLLPGLLAAEGNGGFAGAFLRMGLGARALAMGNAQVASPRGGFGSFYNPAGLAREKKIVAALSYSALALDRRFQYVGLALPLPPFAGLSAGWIYSGVTNLTAYNSIGQQVGEIDHGLHALYFSFGLSVVGMAQQSGQLKSLPSDLLSVGLSVKFLRETLDDREEFRYKGSGFGLDLGVLAHPLPSLWLGYQLKDINSRLASNTNNIFERGTALENKFPLIQRLGLFYQTPWNPLSVIYDFEWSDAGQEEHHLGAEWAGPGIALRAGYDQNRLTAGLGFDFRAFRKINVLLDYAFVDDRYGEGATHVFSWQFWF